MRHVDEGTIHAWLDHQVTDPQDVAWITTHLRECATCSARVAEEEAALRDAESLLASVAPAADGSREAFEALVASARQKNAAPQGGGTRGESALDVSSRVLPFRRWMAPAGLAATIALAIGLGWMARQITSSRGTVTPASAPSMAQHRAEPEAVPPNDVVPSDTAPPPVTSQRRQQEKPSLEPAGKVVEPQQRPSSQRQATLAEAESLPSALELPVTRAEAGGLGPAVTPTVPAAPPPPAPQPTSLAIIPPAPAPRVQTQAGTPAVAQTPTVDGITETTSERVKGPPPPPPAGVAGGVPGGGGGGGGGRGAARGGGGGATGFGAGTGVGSGAGVGPAAASAPTDSLNQGRILVDGLRVGGSTTERVDGIEWTLLARTEAAARSGMALYGIDGLIPARTMVNADASKVRTVYIVNATEIELRQEKQSPPANDAAVVTSDAAAVAFTRSAASAAESQKQQPSPSIWSSVRGDVVLTVRAGADAAALGAMVRLD